MATLTITPEMEADARQIAAATGKSPTEVIADALREQVRVLPMKQAGPRKSLEEIMAMVRSYNLQPLNDLTEDEILGYDEFGIPEQPYLAKKIA